MCSNRRISAPTQDIPPAAQPPWDSVLNNPLEIVLMGPDLRGLKVPVWEPSILSEAHVLVAGDKAGDNIATEVSRAGAEQGGLAYVVLLRAGKSRESHR